MKKILVFILSLCIFTTTSAKDLSEFFSNIVPGEGLTEAEVGLSDADDGEPSINLLMLRNIDKTDSSNLFTQFSLQSQDVGQKDLRYIGNLGFGYRILNEDSSLMLGTNVFYDRDLENKHERGSVGFEARGGNLEASVNFYEGISSQDTVDKRKEQSLGGYDLNISSQIPYMPWARFNYTSYEWDADLATVNTKGKKYSSEFNLTSSLIFEFEYDESGNTGGDDISSSKILFVYPPRDNNPTISTGISSEAFTYANVSDKLSSKVKRKNKLVIETQGAVVFTKK
ncbi:inverse autotransporter beta domain-containing protein [Candidatus Pelagibacter sp.]|nr:inverse autotransporter beta domain-containing protein [Candidatus Pelagibacter sp.]